MRANITLLFLIRSYEPTPKPKEELKFALLDDAKTQKYVPVRQTPAYQPTTPRYVKCDPLNGLLGYQMLITKPSFDNLD